MKKEIASGLLIAGIAAGCSNEGPLDYAAQEELFVSRHKLTVEQVTYPYDPGEAGPKGSGDLGLASNPATLGYPIVAKCVVRPEVYMADENNVADSVLIDGGEFDGMQLPLQVSVFMEDEEFPVLMPVFNISPHLIRSELDFCDSPVPPNEQ